MAPPTSTRPGATRRTAPFTEFAPVALGERSARSRVFVLTGAGISAESGIQTFRDAGGLWEQHRFEDVASPEGWDADADLVWRFYAARRAQAGTCQPNAAHRALAALERTVGDRLFLCTQNVDDLHEKAGNGRVVHMHGELMKSRCESCSRPPFDDLEAHAAIPRCECGARIRPHIVWFGEMPFALERIHAALEACDVFVAIGSSGAVYPAAGFVREVRARAGSAATTIYVGPEAPDNAAMFDECRLGTATEVVPRLFTT
jgi:NAD-dependent deacetylase